jgi:hypothetical protein
MIEPRMSRPDDVGSIVFLEHVNLRVPDHRACHLFFCEGLGFTRDPTRMVGVRNMWVNVGNQQFHLPIGEPTPLPGEVGVVAPDLDAVESRLDAVGRELKDTAFDFRRDGGTLLTATPWGHAVRVHAVQGPPGPGRPPQALAYVEFWVPPGTAGRIAAFYEQVLECPAEADGGATARVTVGPSQSLRFTERPGAAIVRNTNHIAVYLTRYRRIYAALRSRGLLMEEDQAEQFRFAKVTDPAGGDPLWVFEHEMRSLHHPDYRKPLVNRIPVPYRVD